MNTTNETFPIRPGTINEGPDYEVKIIALLSLRCVHYPDVHEMRIASNVKGIGAIDDVVLHVRTCENDRYTFMMQLKHKQNLEKKLEKWEFSIKTQNKNQKGDFLLEKISKDIAALQQPFMAMDKTTEDLGQFDQIFFVLFTNRDVCKDNDMLVNKNGCDKLNCILKGILDTSITIGSLYGFNLEKLPPNTVNKENFKNVYLLANQLSCKDINEQIGVKIKEIVKPTKRVDIENMTQKFIQYIKNWAWEISDTHYYLRKHNVFSKISELFLVHYLLNLTDHKFHYYDDDDNKSTWNQIMCHEKITVVESNNAVLEFLRMYIGSEVKKYCQVSYEKLWSDNLSCQSSFYEINPDLKEQMLKIVGNVGKITLTDVYKCLWMANKLPVLLEVKRIEDYESILHVLTFTNYSHKVIVVINSTADLPSSSTGTNVFRTLQDLSSDYKDAILNLPVKLQSRAGVVLGNVIDENMFQYIKCSDIVNIFSNNFNIGNTLNQLPPYFMERSFIRQFIKAHAVREVNEDVFILDNRSNLYFSLFPQNDFNACKVEDVDYNILHNYKVILQKNDYPAVIKKIKSAGKTVHYLSMHDQNSFQWKWSSGSTRNIKPYQKEEYERDIEPCFSNVVNIISDTAGMGKSTLMDFVQHKAPTNKWVIRVNLNKHQGYFRGCKNSNIDACKHLRYFNDIMLNEQSPSSKLSQMVFEKLLITKDIIVILDGFDEVSFSHEDGVLKIAKSLYLEGYHIWLTTRPHMQLDLEQQFETFSINLKPFSEEDQHQFLAKVFSLVNSELIVGSEFLLKTFVEKLLGAARKNLSDLDAKFTGIPLQGKLLADVFNEDCRNYLLSKGTTCFNETFDLVYLYENFIDKKIEILCNKFGESEINMHNLFKSDQKLFALKLLYPFHEYVKEHVHKKLDEHYKREPGKIQLLQRDGIITVDDKQNINCAHRTFAEFLAATWISENLNREEGPIKEFVHDIIKDHISLRINYQFFYSMLDRLLAYNDCPAHLAIMNKQIESAKEIISYNVNGVIEMLDKGGRSILHIISIYGVQLPLDTRDDFDIQNFESDDMLAILKIIPDDTIRELAIKKDVLGYNPLDYALLHRSFAIAHRICVKIETVTINAGRFELCWVSCLKFNFKPLFKICLPYIVCRDLLMTVADLKEDVLNYFSFNYIVYDVNNHFVHAYEKQTFLQIMQSESGYPYSGYTKNEYSDLRFAVAFGTKHNVLKVLSQGIDVNRFDSNNYTPLHYAILHGKLKMIKVLLLNGAKINIQGDDGNTPLHLAVKQHSSNIYEGFENTFDDINVVNKRYYNITSFLLLKGADVNKQNDFGEVPLLAFVGGLQDVNYYSKYYGTLYSNNLMDLVKLLLSHGASVNTENQNGETVLHLACKNSFNEFVIECLSRIDDINEPNVWGITALHLAVLNGNCDLAKILLLNGADINKPSDFGFTSLYWAKTREMATLLIAKRANIYSETEDGETVLHHQASFGRAGIVNRLLRKGLDVNKQTKNGETALHLAVKKSSETKTFKYERTIDLLLRNGADITIKNERGETPLDYVSTAPRCPHSVKAQLLSSKRIL